MSNVGIHSSRLSEADNPTFAHLSLQIASMSSHGLRVVSCISVVVACFAGSQAVRYRSAAIEAARAQEGIAAQLEQARREYAELSHLTGHSQKLVIDTIGGIKRDAAATARAIRDYVYRTNIVGNSPITIDSGLVIFANLGRPGHEQICGGLSIGYAWALNEVGINARVVQLAAQSFLDGEREGDTHQTVEVMLDGEWRISDPTFNAEFQCGNDSRFLSIEAARECSTRGDELVPVPGATQILGQRVSDYYLPYEKLLAAYEILPSQSNNRISFPSHDWRIEALEHYN